MSCTPSHPQERRGPRRRLVWPWCALLVGLVLLARYGFALVAKRSGSAPVPEPTEPEARPEFLDQESAIIALARSRDFEQALEKAESLLGRTDLNGTERGAMLLIQGRLLLNLKRPAEAIFQQIRSGPYPGRFRAEAFNRIATIRLDAGDPGGAVAVMKELIDSCVDDSEFSGRGIMDVEANYRHHAAMMISECFERQGDWRNAHRWTWIGKERYPFASFCGNAIEQAHWIVEDRLLETARKAGVAYEPEPWDEVRWSRRVHGPPTQECLVGTGLGAAAAAAGGTFLFRRRRLVSPRLAT